MPVGPRLVRLPWKRPLQFKNWKLNVSQFPAAQDDHLVRSFPPPNCLELSSIRHSSQSTRAGLNNPDLDETHKTQRPVFTQASARRPSQASRQPRGKLQQRQRLVDHVEKPLSSRFVTAYCVAEAYNIRHVARILEEAGHHLSAFDDDLAPHVVHFQKLSEDTNEASHNKFIDVFVLASGTVVVWGEANMAYISGSLLPLLTAAAQQPHEDSIEIEDLEFCQDSNRESSCVDGDIIVLGTHRPNHGSGTTDDSSAFTQKLLDQGHTNVILEKVAFSSALARSTKVAILESQLEQYFKSTQEIPMMLKSGKKLPYSRQFVLRKTGELLSMRSQLNLSSELTDSLPNVFWDTRHELGLEECFVQVSRALDIGVRIRALNDKMTYAQEIASVLQDRLSERHGFLLEWLIIALISAEICIEIMRLFKEKVERQDPESLESLMKRYIGLRESERSD